MTFFSQDIREYLSDLGRTSGSTLSMVEASPEDYGLHLAGKLKRRRSPAMGRGAFFHALALEGVEATRGRFGFFPSRAEAQMDEKKLGPKGPRGGAPKKVKTGERVPQDDSPGAEFKSMLFSAEVGTADARAQERMFLDEHHGRDIVYPEDQPLVQAMLRAVQAHPEAAALLNRDEGYFPEYSGHFKCPDTGEELRIRPDALRLTEDTIIELKSVEPRTGDRLDTTDTGSVRRWAADGWARKEALCLDGYYAIVGRNARMAWIIVEAVAHEPRVSVVWSEAGSKMHDLGRDGCSDYGIRGYLDLIKDAQRLRASQDFRAECVREPVHGWKFPRGLLGAMEFQDNAKGGATEDNSETMEVQSYG